MQGVGGILRIVDVNINAGAKIDRITPLTRRDAVYFRSGVHWPEKTQAALIVSRVADNTFTDTRLDQPLSGTKVFTRRIPSWAFPDSVASQHQSVRFLREALLEVPIQCV